jgi:uncharacterized protein YjbI with pentapeptide repeats
MSGSMGYVEDGPPCGRKPLPQGEGNPEGRCVLHLDGPKDPKAFAAAFHRAFLDADPDDVLDCTGFVFPAGFPLRRRVIEQALDLRGDLFDREVNLRDAVFLGEADFGGLTFRAEVNFDHAQFRGEATFDGALFLQGAFFGDAAFDKVTFVDAEFRGEATFTGCTFRDASFGGALFLEHAAFWNTTFREPADFGQTVFAATALFMAAAFEQGALFDGALFAKDAVFQGARFGGPADFRAATLKATVGFEGAQVAAMDWKGAAIHPGGLLRLAGADCAGDVRFDDLLFPTAAEANAMDARRREGWTAEEEERAGLVHRFARKLPPLPEAAPPSGVPDVRLEFTSVALRPTASVRFQGVAAEGDPEERRGRINLAHVRFAHTDVSRIRFHNVRWDGPPAWRTRLGRRLAPRRRIDCVADEHFLRNLPGRAAGDATRGGLDPALVADIYKGLRASYESSLHYAEASAFHVREMEMRRLSLGQRWMNRAAAAPRWQAPLWRALAALRRDASLLNAYRLTSRYGESYPWAFASIAAWFLAIAAFEAWLRAPLVRGLLAWQAGGPLRGAASALHGLHTLAIRAIALMPAQVAGASVTDFVARLGGVFLIAGFIIALRRHFRR